MRNRVWAIGWKDAGEDAERHKEIALVMPGTLNVAEIRTVVEALYLNATATPAEMLAYATGTKNPNQARIVPRLDGDMDVLCGHKPMLCAEYVSNMQLTPAGTWTWDRKASGWHSGR